MYMIRESYTAPRLYARHCRVECPSKNTSIRTSQSLCSTRNRNLCVQILNMNPVNTVQMHLPQTQAAQQMGPSSTHTICHSCGSDIYTRTSRKATASAWWCCILMCITGICSWGCCLIPCCMDSFNIVNHKCPKCSAYLGQYRP